MDKSTRLKSVRFLQEDGAMQSFTHNFNDDVTLEVSRSEHREGQFLISVTTREFYVSGPELESFGYSIWEMLKGEDNDGSPSKDGESSLPESDDEESVEALLSETDTRSS